MGVVYHLPNMDKAWEQFIKFNKIDPQVVRPVIARSWERCRLYGIDPYNTTNTKTLTGIELEARLDRSRDLIRVAVPFMQMLIDACGKDFAIILCNEEGYAIENVGKSTVNVTPAQLRIIGKGCNLGERFVGTNCNGIVLMERVPMQVVAQEHYSQVFHQWTSSAAPILGYSGDIIGVLSICGHYAKVHPHTLGLAISAVKAIENQLHLEKVNNELKKANDFSKTVMESISEGLITVNQQGIIMGINSAGGRIMGLKPAEIIGQPLHELGDTLLPLQGVLLNGGVSDQEAVFENSRGRYRFMMTAQPINTDQNEIIGAVATLRETQAVHRFVANMVGAKARFTFESLIGESKAFQEALSLAWKASASGTTVLLQGESGTGKELFAQAIHNASKRAHGPFIAVNCAAIPRDLIESELFGYEEGAFTGARRGGCPGKFELACGGTIFLDEIGDMQLELQVTLLRFLQEKQVTRLGGRKVIPVDVAVIAATHRNLRQEIEKGNFREDLYYRLNIMSIKIPSLRERQSDIPLLVENFIKKIGHRLGKSIEISKEALSCLVGYSWPGNVRELENALERAINVAPDNFIQLEHLSENLVAAKKVIPIPDAKAPWVFSLKELEQKAIIDVLAAFGGNIAQAARVLGISRKTLYNKIEKYNIKTDKCF